MSALHGAGPPRRKPVGVGGARVTGGRGHCGAPPTPGADGHGEQSARRRGTGPKTLRVVAWVAYERGGRTKEDGEWDEVGRRKAMKTRENAMNSAETETKEIDDVEKRQYTGCTGCFHWRSEKAG